MKKTVFQPRPIKGHLTSKIIDLHQKGYSEDFFKVADDRFLHVTSGDVYPPEDLEIKVYDQIYDPGTKKCYYLHLVATGGGVKGLLVLESINFTRCREDAVS